MAEHVDPIKTDEGFVPHPEPVVGYDEPEEQKPSPAVLTLSPDVARLIRDAFLLVTDGREVTIRIKD